MVELFRESPLQGYLLQLHPPRPWTAIALAERLQVVAGMVRTIQSGELLAALPDCEQARERHILAMSLLAMIEIEIVTLCQIYT